MSSGDSRVQGKWHFGSGSARSRAPKIGSFSVANEDHVGQRIDQGRNWFCRRCGRLVDETLGVVAADAVESVLTGGVDGIDLAVVRLVGVIRPIPT